MGYCTHSFYYNGQSHVSTPAHTIKEIVNNAAYRNLDFMMAIQENLTQEEVAQLQGLLLKVDQGMAHPSQPPEAE